MATGHAEFLHLAVADGAGSARFGGEGAKLATDAAATFFAMKCASPDFQIDDGVGIECLREVRARILLSAEEAEEDLREFACTFLAVLSSSENTLLVQIGDGGIVLDLGDGLQIPIPPMAGEYANMTHFITDENALEVAAAVVLPGRVERAAVFSDGIQRLALDMTTVTPHGPFFEPLFEVIALASSEQEAQLHGALFDFLRSEELSLRTDDDKSLALAVRVEQ